MLTRLSEYQDGELIEADIAIIGAGAAGITLARALVGRGLSICLVESGGADYDPVVQDLYDGSLSGQTYYDLRESRLRFFGGTTAIWGGRCMPFDPIDLRRRSWVRDSGWPLSCAELEPYMQQAGRQLDLRFRHFDDRLRAEARLPSFPLDGLGLETAFWQFDHRFWRFGLPNCSDLAAAADVRLLLGASLADIETTPEARAVETLHLAGLDGRRLRLRARHTVLACGGIENARLLLAARGAMPMGLGNAHDQVGRHFMEHPRALIGKVRGAEGLRLWAAYRAFHAGRAALTPALRLPDATQEARGVLNAAVTMKYRPAGGMSLLTRIYDSARHHGAPNRFVRRLWSFKSVIDSAFVQRAELMLRRAQIAGGRGAFQVMVRTEQAPNPQSRVTLAQDTDALGMPKAHLHWQLGAQEVETARAMADSFAAALDRAGIGGFERAAWLDEAGTDWPADPTVSGHAYGGYHHIGTTRMGENPRHSVVDSDCRVHGVPNLWIAGSSVFPTAGWSNPTLTILALTLRMADRLAVATADKAPQLGHAAGR